MSITIVRSCLLIFCFLTHGFSLQAYITKLIDIELINGKNLIVLSDDLSAYNYPANQANAALLLGAIKNVAHIFPNKTIHFSYEDPLIYAIADPLIPELNKRSELFANLDNFHALALITPNRFESIYSLATLKKGQHMTSFLFGELTKQIATIPKQSWPKNLKITSNDPRRDYYLILKSFVTTNQRKIYLGDMLYIDPNFRRHQLKFFKDDIFPPSTDVVLESLKKELNDYKQGQRDGFAALLGEKYNFNADDDFFNQTIAAASSTIGANLLDDIYDFLFNSLKISDPFSDAPILDVLYSVLHGNAADINIVLLRENLANNILSNLQKMSVIKEIHHAENCELSLANWYLQQE